MTPSGMSQTTQTWPVAWQKRERKILYMFDILAGGKLDNSPKQEVIEKWTNIGGRYHDIRLRPRYARKYRRYPGDVQSRGIQ